MRADQIERLGTLAEDIADQFLTDADPKEWTGYGKTPVDLSSEDRGDAVWCRKLAVQTGALLARVLDLRDRDQMLGRAPLDDGETEAEIKRHEKEARNLLKEIGERSASKH